MNWKYFFRFSNYRYCALVLAYQAHPSSRAEKDSSTDKDSLSVIPQADVTIKKCRELIRKKVTEFGAPGLVIGVSLNGKNVWTEGFGFADIENNVPCTADTVMRIASVSKSFTMAAVAKLMENEKIDLDKEVQDYVPEFPKKCFANKEVKLTTRMLLSNTSGIRHYEKKEVDDSKGLEKKVEGNEFDSKEYYSQKNYKSVIESLDMFKNDELFHEPGQKFLYTTHGWTLVSAVVERASGEDFIQHMENLFTQLGMSHTLPECAENIVYNRARQYTRNSKGRLVNTPYVDNSYKWAGGGFISTVSDMLRFGNVMLYSYQATEPSQEKGVSAFLKPETAKKIWSCASYPQQEDSKVFGAYGMGWFLQSEKEEFVHGRKEDFQIAHTGGAIGGSSILYILPNKVVDSEGLQADDSSRNNNFKERRSNGIVVAMLTNLQSVNLTFLAKDIAEEFRNYFYD